MHRIFCFAAAAVAALAVLPAFAADYPISPVPFTDVKFTDGVFADRQRVNVEVTMPYELDQCERTGRIRNFELAAETMRRRAAGEPTFQNKPATDSPFEDSDVFKYLEGASYAMTLAPDDAFLAKLRVVIDKIKAAQEPDGYLYSFRTMHPDTPVHKWIDAKRWLKDPESSHELYNIGHFYECATAYYAATGDRILLDMAIKSAELVNKDLGQPDSPAIAPGHQVIEMGLAKLYRYTGDERWIKLAAKFLENKAKNGPGAEYNQSHKPVLEQDEAVGHAVRANYMYAGMTDVAALTGDKRYMDAVDKIWNNVVAKKLHLTGGCGARHAGEAYGENFELPNNCYNETCAAIAFLFWTHRMYLMHGDSYYMDVFERTLYNGTFSGVSLSGDRFFYPNPLEYAGNGSDNPPRSSWFGCACCPPNIVRLIASLGNYAYATENDTLYTLLYASGSLKWKNVRIAQRTDYPRNGRVTMKITADNPVAFKLALRIPEWVAGRPLPSALYRYENLTAAPWTLTVNGKKAACSMKRGFAVIDRTWQDGDTVELTLPMEIRRVRANPAVSNLENQVAFERGPIVYAFEQCDRKDHLARALWFASDKAQIRPEYRADLLGGVEILHITDGDCDFFGVPYAVWANRGSHSMRVWLNDALPTSNPTANKAVFATPSASFHRDIIPLANMNDAAYPTDVKVSHNADNFNFWPHRGGSEWAALTWDKPLELSSCAFVWFDDSKHGGGCATPLSWEIKYLKDGEWIPVEVIDKDDNSVRFRKITTTALRFEVKQQQDWSSAFCEWIVR